MVTRFNRWRGGRPFWAGLLAMLAGLEVLLIPVTGYRYLLVQGIGGIGTVLVAVGLVAAGAALWRLPGHGTALGAVVIGLGLVAYVVANLGGFLVGMALAIVAGSLATAWKSALPA
ncbi:DUF6114 domain-containing protein [Saccharothrix sp. BKS2]|uniref:DUF6114 domain-containing protein n=1 Tax=Saccharothrix sp. BKS2 TaxID=3064400 RepID=UPI0039EBA527